jgi:hypothetical protein
MTARTRAGNNLNALAKYSKNLFVTKIYFEMKQIASWLVQTKMPCLLQSTFQRKQTSMPPTFTIIKRKTNPGHKAQQKDIDHFA